MFNNKLAENAAKAIAATKEIYSQKTAIGAYQSMVQSLTFAFPSDREAIYEATGLNARPVPTVPLIGRQMQAVPRRPMFNGKPISKPCPTCGSKVKVISQPSNQKAALRKVDQGAQKEVDELLAGLNFTDPAGQESEIKSIEVDGIELSGETAEALNKGIEDAKRQKAIQELSDMRKDELRQEDMTIKELLKVPPDKAKTREDIKKEIEKPKNKGGRPRIKKDEPNK